MEKKQTTVSLTIRIEATVEVTEDNGKDRRITGVRIDRAETLESSGDALIDALFAVGSLPPKRVVQ